MLTFERANELFHYNPSSGGLTWKKITTNGVTGVCIRYTRKGTLRYAATITVNFKPIFLGNYDTLGDAARARKSAEFLYVFHPNQGYNKYRQC